VLVRFLHLRQQLLPLRFNSRFHGRRCHLKMEGDILQASPNQQSIRGR
jgi:hypothetical protein